MKSKVTKKLITFALCISMLLSNVCYASAMENSTAESEEEIVTSIETSEADEELSEDTLEEEGDVTVSPSPSAPVESSSDEEKKTIDDGQVPMTDMPVVSDNSIEEDSVSANSVSENSVSANSVSENSIDLPLSEDGNYYVLSKDIEGRDISITLNIPVTLFPEAKEITFDAIEAEEEVKEKFEDVVNEEISEDKLVDEAILFDITLFVDQEQVEGKLDEKIQVLFSGAEVPTRAEDEEEISAYYFDDTEETIQELEADETTTEMGEEAIATEVEHFSLYGVVRKNSGDYNSRMGILNALGDARFFSVFARNFTNNSHSEGNVAIETYAGGNSGIDVFGSNNKAVNAAMEFKLKISKKVDSSANTARVFYFSVFDNMNHSNSPVATARVTVEAGKMSGETSDVTLSNGANFDSTKVYYVFETDSTGQVVENGATFTNGNYMYTVDFDCNEISSLFNENYIQHISCHRDSKLFNENDNGIMENRIIFGTDIWKENLYVKEDAGWRYDDYRTKISDNLNNTEISIANGPIYKDGTDTGEKYGNFPIDFGAEFGELENLSKALATSGGDDIHVENINSSGINGNDIEKIIERFPEDLIIINVTCANNSSVTLNNLNMKEYFNANKKSKYNNVIWNFLKKDGKTPYTGTITIPSVIGGTVLAPVATVISNSILEGTAIAKNLTITGEIHEVYLTDTPDYNVVNVECSNKCETVYIPPEPTESVVEQDKTAELINWDDRTYDINLKAWTNSEMQTNNDIILVLDCSGSMAGNKLTSLKEAAKSFIEKLSIGDKVAIVPFYEDLRGNRDYVEITTENQKSSLYNTINAMKADGGTNQSVALNQAYSYLSKNTPKTTHKQSVILFTDGVPDIGGGFFGNKYAENCMGIVRQSNTAANNIKKAGATIYTVAYDMAGTDSSEKWYYPNNSKTPQEWLKQDIASSEECAYEASSDLNGIFNQLSSAIKGSVTIKDTIDIRFELLDEKGGKYTSELINGPTAKYGVKHNNGQLKESIESVYGGTLTADDKGRLVLTWKDVNVSDIYKESDNAQGGWNKTLHVVAKEDYIGDNDVPTNYGPGSNITTESDNVVFENGDGDFPEPKVNVKIRFEADKDETTMFWGEQLGDNKETVNKGDEQGTETFTYLNDDTYKNLLYYNGLDFVQKTNVTWNNGKVDLYEYTEDGRAEKPLEYSAEKFDTKWYAFKEGENPQYNEADVIAKEELQKVSKESKFAVEFTYINVNPSTEGNAASTLGGKTYRAELDRDKAIATYEVKIIAGELTIKKSIQGDYTKLDGDPIFTYKIEDVSNDKIDGFTKKTYYKTLRFMEGAKGELYATIKGLPKGEYVISELDTMGFEEVSHSIVSENTNCYTAERDTFYLGYRRKGVGTPENQSKHKYDAKKGEMKYINQCIHTPGKLTYTDAVKNTFVVGENGTAWNISEAKEEVDNGYTQKIQPYAENN